MSGAIRATVGPVPDVPCTKCGAEKLRIEMRPVLVAKPPGSYSLAGVQMKHSAVAGEWPWMVCDGCGAECEGRV